MDASDWSVWAAWYGAGLSTLTTVVGASWEIYKYKTSGPRLKLEAWYHRDPQSNRVLVLVEIRNKGDAPTRIEYIQVAQDGLRFEPSEHIAVDRDCAPAKFKESVASNDNVVYMVQPFDRPRKDPPSPVRRLDGERLAVVYVRAAAFKKELVAKVKPPPRNDR